MKEPGTLIIYKLTVESSYADDFERPAEESFDTIQWWIGNKRAWRIKTYAVDNDIHPYRLETNKPKSELLELAAANTKKNYGDVIGKRFIIEIPDGPSEEIVRELLRNQGLKESHEWVDSGYFLWLPDGIELKTKTKPKLR